MCHFKNSEKSSRTESQNSGGLQVLPAAHATHTALLVRPTDSVLTRQLRRHTRDIKNYRSYAEFRRIDREMYPKWGGHEAQADAPEIESASKWDLVPSPHSINVNLAIIILCHSQNQWA